MDDLSERILKVTNRCDIATGVVHLKESEFENSVNGGILSNSKVSWIACGPRLTIINADNGSKRTGWTFGWAHNDPTYKVACVEELPISGGGSPILIVGCESEAAGHSLCFYHSGSSRVLKAIHFTEKITSLSLVSNSSEASTNISHLKHWSGIVAVGTGGGKVYLLDVWWHSLKKCMDDYQHKLYDEQRPSELMELSKHDLVNRVNMKSSSVRDGSCTLALWLNEECMVDSRKTEKILGRTPREFLSVSALKFFLQTNLLAVGFNTSCFQLWDLSTLTLQYTSSLLEAMLPVFSFALLEPSDDPRIVCFLWSLHHSVDEDSLPFAVMYGLSYRNKQVNKYNNEAIYEGFSSCRVSYQLDLGNYIENAVSGRIVSCQSLVRGSSKSPLLWLQTDSEESTAEETSTSLLVIVWEVWDQNQIGMYRRLTLFDLNQWYRECMPNTSDTEYSRFMSHFCLPNGALVTAEVLPKSVKHFVSLQPVDEHFYPAGTSFECLCLEQSHVVACVHTGMQEECFQTILDAGPSGLLLPAPLYKLCRQAGIKPLLADVMTSPASPKAKDQRDYVMTVVLEYGMTQYLRNCVHDWADGSHAVAECTLPSLLRWAWGRVQQYKMWLDTMCVPLFDCSGIALDSNDLGMFQHVISLVHSTRELFRLVLIKYRTCVIQDTFEQQHMAIQLVTSFYDSVMWCVRHKVLPEVNMADALSKELIPYLSHKIINSTIARRVDLHHLGRSMKYPLPTGGLFMIDTVITHEAGGNKLTDQWEREGGGTTLGLYPPPSVQSLLRTYLVRDIPLHIKHFIVSYFLQDVIHALQSQSLDENTKDTLLKYPADFRMTESKCKIVQAFWFLDHKYFEEGVSLLLDNSVAKEDLPEYQHRTVVSLLAASGEHKLALHYLNVKRPALTDHQDIRMKMTLMLLNNLIHEAFEYQRQHHPSLNTELLQQFFTGCVEMNKLEVVFKLPLTSLEEEAFMTFLEKSTHPQGDDLRILYLLSRSRYIEAIDMNEKLRCVSGTRRGMASLPLGHGPLGQSPLGPRSRNLFGLRDQATGAPTKAVLTTRDLIISSVAKSLPSITRDLADLCNKKKNFNWKQVTRPAPLSVVVHTELTDQRLPFYKMTNNGLMEAALAKTRETWVPLLATPALLKRKLSSVQDMPFLSTPLIPRTSANHLTTMNETRTSLETKLKNFPILTKRPKLDTSPVNVKDASNVETSLDKLLDITCPETAALLHTPLVAKSVWQPKEVLTPHSILKGGSGANTPNTPALERTPVATRQIRFRLPATISPSSSKEEDEDSYSLSISPRKSIHDHLSSRKATPAHPKIPKEPIRNIVTSLKFYDEETETTDLVRPSATAMVLLKNISSPTSSDDTFVSMKSSSSKESRSEGSELLPKSPKGLEEDSNNGSEGGGAEFTLTEVKKFDVAFDLPLPSVSDTFNNGTITPSAYQIRNEMACVETPKVVKMCVESTYSTSKKHEECDIEEEFLDEENSGTETDNMLITLNWTEDNEREDGDKVVLHVNKQDEAGAKQCVGTVTLSGTMPLFYSESKETEQLQSNVELTENQLSPQSTPSIQNKSHQDKVSINEIPLPQVLEEILKRGRISSSPKNKPSLFNISRNNQSKTIDKSSVTDQDEANNKSELKTKDVNCPIVSNQQDGIQIEHMERNKLTATQKEDYLSSGNQNVQMQQKTSITQSFVSVDNTNISSTVPITEASPNIDRETETIPLKSTIPITGASPNKDRKTETMHFTSTVPITKASPNKDWEIDMIPITSTVSTAEASPNKEWKIETKPLTSKVPITTEASSNKDWEIQTIPLTSKVKITEASPNKDWESILPNKSGTEKPQDFSINDKIVVESKNIKSTSLANELAEDSTTNIDLHWSEDDSSECINQNEKVLVMVENKLMNENINNSEIVEESVVNSKVLLESTDNIQLSEGAPTIVNKLNNVEDEDVQESEMTYETLTPVKVQIEIGSTYDKEELEDDYYEEDANSDIYGDLDEEQKDEEENQNTNERYDKEESREVICLDSSSNESYNSYGEKPSSNKKSTPKRSNQSWHADQTLDYEESYEEGDQEEDVQGEDEFHRPSESSDESDDGSVNSNNSLSNSTDSTTTRQRRSWKKETRISSDELESDEITIESPPFEIIGQRNSPDLRLENVEDEVPLNIIKKTCDKKLNTVELSPSKVPVGKGETELDKAPFEIIRQCNSPGLALESIEEEVPLNIIHKTSETKLDIVNLSASQVPVEESDIQMDNVNTVSKYDDNNINIESNCDDNINFKPKCNDNDETESNVATEARFTENKNDPDSVTILERCKRRQVIETGSIAELQKRRSKRFSSSSDLHSSTLSKTRRRSRSFHDFASLLIMETKSRRSLSKEDVANADAAKINTLHFSPEVNKITAPSDLNETELSGDAPICSTPFHSEVDMSTKNINLKSQDLIKEPAKTCTVAFEKKEVFSLSTCKWFEKQTKHRKSLANFSTSLQNITEELSASSGLSGSIDKKERTLRRSSSSNDMENHGTFEALPGLVSRSHNLESNKVTMDMEVDNHTRSSEASDVVSHCETHLTDFNKSVVETTFKDSYSLSCNTLNENQNSIMASSLCENKEKEIIKPEPMVYPNVDSPGRNLRASSEPLRYQTRTSTLRRNRSSSTSVLSNFEKHEKIIFRHSLNKRTSQQNFYTPLEIVHSDEDSFIEMSQADEYKNEPSNTSQIDSSHELEPEEMNKPLPHSISIEEDSPVEEQKLTALSPSKKTSSVDRNGGYISNVNTSQRSQSEPPDLDHIIVPKISTRSASSSKIDQMYKHSNLSRYSLRTSLRKSVFQPLEVIQSDEESSFNQSIRTPDNRALSKTKTSKTTDNINTVNISDIVETDDTDSNNLKRSRNVSKRSSKDEDTATESRSLLPAKKRQSKKQEKNPSIQEIDGLQNIKKDVTVVNTIDAESSPNESSKVTKKGNKGNKKRNNVKQIDLDKNKEKSSTDNDDILPISQESQPSLQVTKTEETLTTSANIDYSKPPKKRGRPVQVDQNLDKASKSPVENPQSPIEDSAVYKLHQSTPVKITSKKRKKTYVDKGNTDSKKLRNKKNTLVKSKNDEPKSTHDDFSDTDINNLDVDEEGTQPGAKTPDNTGLETSTVDSLAMETPKRRKSKVFDLDDSLKLLDSPARRTRLSISRLSNADLSSIESDSLVNEPPRRKVRKSGTMSDIGSPVKYSCAESESSDVSTSSRLHTPTRRSYRRQSISEVPSTSSAAELTLEEILKHRRLTRQQHAQLRKNFDISFKESPSRISRLEDLPEEVEESTEHIPSTPTRSSSRNANKTKPSSQSRRSSKLK